MMTELKLSKPITVHGKAGAETVSVLSIREPTGDLLLAHGMPFASLVTPDPQDPKRQSIEIRMIPPVFREYVKAMTGLDAGVIGQLAFADLNKIYQAILESQGGGAEAVAAEGN